MFSRSLRDCPVIGPVRSNCVTVPVARTPLSSPGRSCADWLRGYNQTTIGPTTMPVSMWICAMVTFWILFTVSVKFIMFLSWSNWKLADPVAVVFIV